MTTNVLQRKCACGQAKVGGDCEQCKKKRTALQRKTASSAHTAPSVAPPIVDDVLRSSGQPLDAGTRAPMEQHFGHDFSNVRVHADAKAAESARAVDAQAYTVGRHVVFGTGRYRPAHGEGRRLLAHELTHVVQQGAGEPAGELRIGPSGDAWERQADRLSSGLDGASGRASGIRPLSGARVQRERGGGSPAPATPPTCVSTRTRTAPPAADLQTLLIDRGVISGGTTLGFRNVLHRHVTAGTALGTQYLTFVRAHAYPHSDFCVRYQGHSWNRTFREVVDSYGFTSPTERSLRGAVRTVLDRDRRNWVVIDEEATYPAGQAGPAAPPLTPRTLRSLSVGTILSGPPTTGALLLMATDDFVDTLAMSAATVTAATPAAATSGPTTAANIFAWAGTGTGAVGNPNRFDDQIVHWTNHFNDVFQPVDRRGRPNPLDPDLVKAMIFVESRFNEAAANPSSSARGLLQMLGSSRTAVGNLAGGVTGITTANFADPSVQIASGIRWLFQKYNRSRSWETAVRDYNGSPRRDAYRDHVLRIYRSHRRTAPASTSGGTP